MALLNWMINHPEISPHVRDDSTVGELNIAPLNNHTNVFLVVNWNGEPAGFATMLSRGFGVYEQHSGMLEHYRGHHALKAGREVLKWMFLNTDCDTMATWAWSSAKHVAGMAKAIGFIEDCRSKWPNTVKGESVDRITFTLTLAEWSRRFKDDFVEDSIRMNLGVEPMMMGFDAIFARMAIGGHAGKAQHFYNRWASVFGAVHVRIADIRAATLIVEIGHRVFEIAQDLSTNLIQGEPLCQSQQQSHT